MEHPGFWHRRSTRIALYGIIFLLSLLVILASNSLGDTVIRLVRDGWYTEEEYRTAAAIRQAGTLTGAISGLGLVLESSKLGDKDRKQAVLN